MSELSEHVHRNRALRAAGVEVTAYGSYLGRFGQVTLEHAEREAMIAAALGTRLLHVWAEPSEDGQQDLAPVVGLIRAACDAARADGITVVIERHLGSFADTPARIARLLNAIDRPNVALNYQVLDFLPPSAVADQAADTARLNPEPFDYFRYERYTHAYFPQDHFDEVVQDGQWTFGKFRDGYIALYSYRPTEWISYDPTVVATNGMVKPFDLRANGGPTNVWIVECGRAHEWQSFERFRTAIAASHVEVTELANGGGGIPNSFDVVYDSPSQGHMTFGWEQPLAINGHDIAITGYQRYDNPWAQTPFNTHAVRIEDAGYGVELDFERGVRTVFGPQP